MSSVEASTGVCYGSGQVATAIGLLITQRSRVQIPPPLLVFAGQDISRWERAFGVSGHVTTTGAGALPEAETSPDGARQSGTRLSTLLAISGRLARKYRWRTSLSHPCWPSPNVHSRRDSSLASYYPPWR